MFEEPNRVPRGPPPKGPRHLFTEPLKPRVPVEDQAINPPRRLGQLLVRRVPGGHKTSCPLRIYHGSLKRSGRESAADEVAEREGDEMVLLAGSTKPDKYNRT